jgi:hypothetical protein
MGKIYYMHTIDRKPAGFVGEQICHASNTHKPVLCTSLRQIRREQQKSIAYRRRNGWDVSDYGYCLVTAP